MNTLFLVRKIFRGLLLLSLLFRWFFVDKFSYEWDRASYILLVAGLVGVILLEIILYIIKKKGGNHD
jgi:hypothetical protein